MVLKGKSKYIFIFLGSILIFISFAIIIMSCSKSLLTIKKEETSINNFIDNTSIILVNNSENENSKKITEEEEKKESKNDYIAVLEIPSINLKRGLVDFNSKYNDVKYNVQIIEKYNMPDVENGNLILASHNGNSKISFFKNLSKLSKESLIYVYYEGYKYIYEYSYSYDILKDGEVEIVRDFDKTTITLITCKSNDKNKQVVYIGYLIGKVKY